MSGRDGAASVIRDTWKPYHNFSSLRNDKHPPPDTWDQPSLGKHEALTGVRHLLVAQ